MSYIVKSDITDSIIKGFDIQPYLTETDSEINDVAETLGVYDGDIEDDPVHYKIKRYGICNLLMRFCQDKATTNEVETSPEYEKYMIKYKMYQEECERIKPKLVYEMFAGTVSRIRDRSMGSGTIFIG